MKIKRQDHDLTRILDTWKKDLKFKEPDNKLHLHPIE